MSEAARLGNIAVIVFGILVLAWLSRRAAIDIDEHGGPGWILGLLVFFMPPLGLLAWLLMRTSRNTR